MGQLTVSDFESHRRVRLLLWRMRSEVGKGSSGVAESRDVEVGAALEIEYVKGEDILEG